MNALRSFVLLAVVVGLFLNGCGGYRAALEPIDPPPVVKEFLTTESQNDDRSDWPTWKKVVFYGTVGH